MRKIVSAIILGFLVIGLLAPMANFALAIGGQDLNSCCKISSKFSAFHKTTGTGASAVDYPIVWDHQKICIVGESGGPCVIDNKDYSATMIDTAEITQPSGKSYYDCGGINETGDGVAMEGWGLVCLLNTVYNVTNWIFYLMMIAIVILFVVAGAKYMMSSGDAEKTKSAKNLIIFGIVGLIVALVAKLIPSVVKLIVGM